MARRQRRWRLLLRLFRCRRPFLGAGCGPPRGRWPGRSGGGRRRRQRGAAAAGDHIRCWDGGRLCGGQAPGRACVRAVQSLVGRPGSWEGFGFRKNNRQVLCVSLQLRSCCMPLGTFGSIRKTTAAAAAAAAAPAVSAPRPPTPPLQRDGLLINFAFDEIGQLTRAHRMNFARRCYGRASATGTSGHSSSEDSSSAASRAVMFCHVLSCFGQRSMHMQSGKCRHQRHPAATSLRPW